MSIRGLTFKFNPSESVLCFEPDPSKARVLYDGKILEQTSYRDKDGKRQPSYFVHFQGWNSIWDREVPASFILQNNQENRQIMKLLAITARRIRNNHKRMRKIDQILRQYNIRPHRIVNTDEPGISEEENEHNSADEQKSLQFSGWSSVSSGPEENDSTAAFSSSGLDDSNDELNKNSNEDYEIETVQPTDIELNIPKKLKVKLEEEFILINRHDKVVNLPAKTPIITILESYVKNTAVLLLKDSCTDRPSYLSDIFSTSPKQVIELTKETAHGLRLLIDFMLPSILLYNKEKNQFDLLKKPIILSPEKSQRICTQNDKKVLPLSQSFSKSKVRKVSNIRDLPEASKRVTRSTLSEKNNCLPSKKVSKKQRKSFPGPGSKRRFSNRLSLSPVETQSCENYNQPSFCFFTNEQIKKQGNESSKSDSQTESNCTPESSNTHCVNQEEYLSKVLNWTLFPPNSIEETCRTGVLPSKVYGISHLLRLFVKLPEILSQMHIPKTNVTPLTQQLKMLLGYMNDMCDELFLDLSYIDGAKYSTQV